MLHAQFIKHVANVTGETEGTVKLAFRTLREAGLISGGRGVNAPDRTSIDAALFLCWIGFSSSPGLSAQLVRDFGTARARGSGELALGVQPGDRLIDVLAAIIDAEADGESLPPYNLEFNLDELNMAIDVGFERAFFSLEDTSAEDGTTFEQRYGKPYRVTRIFPRSFVAKLAEPFRAPAETGQVVEGMCS